MVIALHGITGGTRHSGIPVTAGTTHGTMTGAMIHGIMAGTTLGMLVATGAGTDGMAGMVAGTTLGPDIIQDGVVWPSVPTVLEEASAERATMVL